MIVQKLTLCLIHDHEKILLGMKKRGFGSGKWNGFGGKVAQGEGLEEAAKRETLEECGLTVERLAKKGILEFRYAKSEGEVLEVHIFKVEQYTGEPEESEEMRPQWFRLEEIPFTNMWPDDSYWLPLLLAGKCFTGGFHFGEDGSVLEYQLQEVGSL